MYSACDGHIYFPYVGYFTLVTLFWRKDQFITAVADGR